MHDALFLKKGQGQGLGPKGIPRVMTLLTESTCEIWGPWRMPRTLLSLLKCDRRLVRAVLVMIAMSVASHG
jgi:hypothetical protein